MKPVLAVIVAASLALGPTAAPVAAFPADGAVTSLSVVPASGRAELVIGVAGTELSAREREWLHHDACAGVILFARNVASKAQVAELSQAIREAAPRPQLVCVDQEGGRVQRFRDGYTAFPPLEKFDAL